MQQVKQQLRAIAQRKNIQVVVALGLVCDARGQLLLTRRHEPALPAVHGCWEVPGGKIEFGESPSHTVAREIYEETGYRVQPDETQVRVKSKVWKYSDTNQSTILITYRCVLIGGTMHVGGGSVADVQWFRPNDVPYMIPYFHQVRS